MKALSIDASRPDRPLVYSDFPEPVMSETDLMIAVKATGVTRADLRRMGNHFAASEKHPDAITGLEFAGEVIAAGSRTGGFAKGDRVMAMAGGANAERAVVDYRLALPVPRSYSFEEAAATPISFLTAYNALVDLGDVKASQSLLIQGGSASVGVAAIQIARIKGVGQIFGTASTEQKLAKLCELGCDVAVNYRSDDVASKVLEATGGRGVDLIVDLIGGPTAQGNVDAARIGGTIVCVGRVEDRATLNLNEFARKRLRMLGASFRTRSLEERADIVRRFRDDIGPHLESRRAYPMIDTVFPIEQAEKALDRIRDHPQIGKIILRVGD